MYKNVCFYILLDILLIGYITIFLGIIKIALFDYFRVETTNTNERQIFGESQINKNKYIIFMYTGWYL